MYSKYLSKRLKAIIEQVEADRPSLDMEIKLLRVLTVQAVQILKLFEELVFGEVAKRNGGPDLSGYLTAVDLLKSLIGEVRSCEETFSRMQDRRSITPEQVMAVVQGLIRVLDRHVEKDVLQKVSEDFNLIPWPSGINVGFNKHQGQGRTHDH